MGNKSENFGVCNPWKETWPKFCEKFFIGERQLQFTGNFCKGVFA
jgi:hypothetical protein